MKEKHGVALQNIFMIILPVLFFIIWDSIPGEKTSQFAEAVGKNFMLIIGWFMILLLVAGPILNFIRSNIKYKKQVKKADEWWENTGRHKIVELNHSIHSISAQADKLLNANPLYQQIKSIDTGSCNSKDCYMMYQIANSYRLNSFEDVISIYCEKKIREYEREEAEYRHQQILDALEEANAESVRLREEIEAQGRRADFDRSILELQLFEIKNRH